MNAWPAIRWAPAVLSLGLSALLPATGDGTAPSPAARGNSCPGICGRVTAARTGKPIVHFTLAVFSAERPEFPAPQFKLPAGFPVPPGPLIATYDIDSADGSFAIASPNASSFYVGASASGYWPRETAAVTTGDGPIAIELEERGKVIVKIVDEKGHRVEGAAIHRDSPTWPLAVMLDSAASEPPFARSDHLGELRIDEPYLADTPLLVLSDRMLPQRVAIAKGRREVVVELHEGVPFRGVTRSSDGKPIKAAVEARCDATEPIRALSRVDGTYSFNALPRGRCELLASRDIVDEGRSLDPIRGLVTVDLSSGASAADITIPPAGIVRGRITGLGITRPGYTVLARNGEEVVRFAAESNGAFWQRMTPARWQLRGIFEEDGMHLETAEVAVEIEDGRQREVELPFSNRATIQITVNGQPLRTVLTVEPESPGVSTRVRTGPTREGTYEIAGLQKGTYRAQFTYGSGEYETEVVVPSTSTSITLQLYEARIRLLDTNRAAVRGEVRIEKSDHIPSAARRLDTQKQEFYALGNGDYLARELVPGRYRVAILASGYRERQVEIEVPGESVDVVLATRDRPFPRPVNPKAATDEELSVLALVVTDLVALAREPWKQTGQRRGRLVVADETVSRPNLQHASLDRDEDVAILKKLERRDVMRNYEKSSAVIRRLPHESRPGVLHVPLGEFPIHPPDRWSEAGSETDLFDPTATAQRWDNASGFAFLTTPELSEDGTEAVTIANLYVEEALFTTRLYWLIKRDGTWTIKSYIDFGFGGC